MTFVKSYTNDEMLEKDVNKLKDNNISSNNIFILSHDDDRTARIVNNTEASVLITISRISEEILKNQVTS